MRLGDFTETEVRALHGMHAAETGQAFSDDALARAFDLTQGQPWLVNALAREVIEEMRVPPPTPIEAHHIERAGERLILSRTCHLYSLPARLMEPRVRRVIEPIVAGTLQASESGIPGGEAYEDDFAYVKDLGLVAPDSPPRIANPIYREVIVRVLTGRVEPRLTIEPRSFVASDGTLDIRRLLEKFTGFWRQHGEVLVAGMPYHEVAPQLVLMAYLQRIVNGGGLVEREYGIGRGRIDLHVRWPLPAKTGPARWQNEALELKVWRDRGPDPLPEGLGQLEGYLERLGLNHGTLVIFDRRTGRQEPAERAELAEQRTPKSGLPVMVLRL